MSKQGKIRLWPAQRRKLRRVIRTGKHSAREILHAHILLKTAEGWTDQQIAKTFYVSHDTIERTRTRFIAEGLEGALQEQARPGAPSKLSTDQETLLTALACSKPPAGHRRWTVRLLAERAVKLEIVSAIAPETVRQILKKTRSSPGC
jgi:transposase